VWPARRKLWGGGIGVALVVSSALFAAAHLVIEFDPRRLAVFFPALLFGWMRSATGSIAAGATTHAASNLLMKVLAMSYFRR
jgi:membrane protease YdiL (CAAX protease family)